MPEDTKSVDQKPTEDPTQPKEANEPIDSAPGEPHTPNMPDSKTVSGKKPKNKKKMMMIIAIIVLLLIGAVVAWYFLIKKDKAPVVEDSQTSTTETITKTSLPANVAYAFRDSDKVPYTLFTRPATGGERSQAQILPDRDARIIFTDVNGKYVAFSANEDVYASSDGGEKYTLVLDSKSNEQVTSIKFSSDGSKLAVGHIVDAAGKNIVKSIDMATGEATDLFEAATAGAFILGLNDQEIIYQEGCFNCDGRPEGIFSNSLDGTKKTALVQSGADSIFSSPEVSSDLSTLIYVDNSVNSIPDGIGDDVTAPYKITSLNVGTKEKTVLATVGEVGEKSANGTNLFRSFILGFTNNDQSPWFAEGKKITALRESNPVIYESTADIFEVFFVNTDTIIASTGTYDNFSLGSFNRTNQETTELLKGDGETIIFGVTTN